MNGHGTIAPQHRRILTVDAIDDVLIQIAITIRSLHRLRCHVSVAAFLDSGPEGRKPLSWARGRCGVPLYAACQLPLFDAFGMTREG